MKLSQGDRRTFVEETRERVKRMDDCLRRLAEGSASDQEETAHALFREVHSLKGAAGALGFPSVATLAHAVETALEPLRAKTLALDPELRVALSASFQWLLGHAERSHLAVFLDVGKEVAALEHCVAEARRRQGISQA